ncbi:peroxidase-related enzyme [Denitromonas halophila]|uniref:Peroxidase-related enzyme n=1 Tax=Denitromonas halophila TaxID=1629404 RepID=A0A557QY25_9RHOO|nr:peroxidase-related enzyme [Denitromonas halophila]TVO57824.1 peroxidase-related enzyme [Denitromonas halophila]
MTDRISRFPVPELTDLADDVRERILGVQEKAGFIPNVFLMLAHRPAEFRAFFDYHDALMEKNEGLTKAEREMIVVATSGAGNCLYCVVAHGAVLRIRAKNARVADQLATNYRKAEITERQRAMLDFAMKLSTNGGAVEDADMAVLREHGFDDEAIWDIGAITAFFAMSNRLVHLTGTPPNEPFYLMGRLPKGS